MDGEQKLVMMRHKLSCTHQISDSFPQLSDFLLQVEVPLSQSLNHLLWSQSSIHLVQAHTQAYVHS